MEVVDKNRKRKSISRTTSPSDNSPPLVEPAAKLCVGGVQRSTNLPPTSSSSTQISQLNLSPFNPVCTSDVGLPAPTVKRRYNNSTKHSLTASLRKFTSANPDVSEVACHRINNQRTSAVAEHCSPSPSSAPFSVAVAVPSFNSNPLGSVPEPPCNTQTNHSSIPPNTDSPPVLQRSSFPMNNSLDEPGTSTPTTSLRPVHLLQDIGKWRKRRNRVLSLQSKRIYNSTNLRNVCTLHLCSSVTSTRRHRGVQTIKNSDISNSELWFFSPLTNVFRANPNLAKNNIHQRCIFKSWDFGPPTTKCRNCGATVWFEERNRKDDIPSSANFSVCCQGGKVCLPLLKETPPLLKILLDYKQGGTASRFREQIRIYNSMFAFTSMGGHVDNSVNDGKGVYVFRLNGQNHHKIGSLLPVDGVPKFAQLYIYDTENERENRLRFCSRNNTRDVDPNLVQKIIHMFDETNELAKVFRMARDRFKVGTLHDVSIRIISGRNNDGRQYNLPTSSEIAALIVGNDNQPGVHRDIVLEEKTGILCRINEKHPSFMAMQYPILFPYAEDGYRSCIEYRNAQFASDGERIFLTMREYYAFRLQNRQNEGQTLLRGGRLLQQYIVDAYTCIEEDRLRWIRHNQSNIRSDLYKGLQDAVVAGDTSAKSIGKRTILPSSFTGGPRYMVQNYQDAVAICRWGGCPDLFITFTCNSKWPEIRYILELIPGQQPQHRPDIIARVFHIKLKQFIEDVFKNGHFGRAKAVIYTIEFQKRGLPHAHILLFLHADDKPKTTLQVDRIVSAEVPDPNVDPIGCDAVGQFMVHGPCGLAHKGAQCMDGGVCGKHYPKSFTNDTSFDKDGFPIYKRRQNGHSIRTSTEITVDSRWIVPHNIDLLVKYNAHINVEVCNKTKSVKYLFKYINKGHDRATVIIEENVGNKEMATYQHDEIKRYLDCRYVSASEACWRIFEFEVQYRKPSVQRLQFHLPGEHTVTFTDNDNISEIVGRQHIERTMFTEWMRTNAVHVDARCLTYVDFPSKWVWYEKDKHWRRRKQGDKIGRIYYAHPTSGERFYLRMLLTVVKGPTCYEDIRTVNGTLYSDFQSACVALGLLENDNEWNTALCEAGNWSSGKTLRQMFATMLLFCEISNPFEVWNSNWEMLSDDIQWHQRRIRNNTDLLLSDEELKNYCLIDLETILNLNNRSLADFPLMPMPNLTITRSHHNRLIEEELSYDCPTLQQEACTMLCQLNVEQKTVFDVVTASVYEKAGGFFFVYGSGGTGKTFLWNTIITTMRSEGKIVLAVASSGIASLLLPGGRTAHSRFKIPIDVGEDTTCGISKQSNLAQLIIRADLIIWDEAPMVHRNSLEAFDRTLRDLMDDGINCLDERTFGGKTVLLGGDFRQVLPVIPKGSRTAIVQSSINKSHLWSKCRVFKLNINMRLKSTDGTPSEVKKLENFTKWVLSVGDGKVPAIALQQGAEPTWIKIPQRLLIEETSNPTEAIVRNTYPDLQKRMKEPNYLRLRCILTPTNDCVEEINSYITSTLSGSLTTYLSADTISPASEGIEDQHILFPTEFLNTLNPSGVPSHKLNLKVGIPIMLLRNINQSMGLCNGTRLIVTQLAARVVEAEIITGTYVGNKVFIPRIVHTSANTKWPFILRRLQFPIKVCFAMTINKSQGQTLDHVGVYLPRPVFSHGQLYVAISRTTSEQGLQMLIKQQGAEEVGYTENIVFHEIFEDL